MADISEVPLIDFSSYSLETTDTDSIPDSSLQVLAKDIYKALSTVGFCYIKNHGLHQTKINELFRVSKHFFTQPNEVKTACGSPIQNFNGYQALEKERLTPTRPGDLKETFNYTPCDELLGITWPSTVEDMEIVFHDFFMAFTMLAHRVLDVLSIALNRTEFQDGSERPSRNRNYLRQRHKSFGKKDSPATLRSIYYPPLPDNGSIKAGQLRCGEHTDYGTVALLFQDKVGGLEIKTASGEFVSVPPIEGTVVVNIGDLMQRWTADKLKATVHRVVIPEDEVRLNQCRQSAVLFVDPDDGVIIECLDGSGKYSPVFSHDFVEGRINATYTDL